MSEIKPLQSHKTRKGRGLQRVRQELAMQVRSEREEVRVGKQGSWLGWACVAHLWEADESKPAGRA